MSEFTVYATNGVSFGFKRVVTADDVSDGAITFNMYGVDYDVVAAITVTSAAGVNKPLDDAVITLGTGIITLANGAVTFALAVNDIVSIVANRAETVS